MNFRTALVLSVMLIASSTGADALCIYGGKHFTPWKDNHDWGGRMNATTTLKDEFLDSALVVKGTVLSSRSVGLNPPDDNGWGTVYTVRVDQIFKGKAPATITYFTERDSGGFYLSDNPGEDPHFLLFLDPIRRNYWGRRYAPHGFYIHFNCGQSREWKKVSPQAVKQLNALAARRPAPK